jgi:uncharacterized protein (UPF0333 family)
MKPCCFSVKSRSQAAVEYIMVLSILMMSLGYTSYYVIFDSKKTMDLATAQEAVDSLAKAANTVYSLGPCSKTYA